MFKKLIIYLENILMIYEPLGIFIASIVEEIIAPIPSTLVIMSTSFLMFNETIISLGSIFKLFINIVLPASAGVTIGSLLVYSIGYFLGKPFLERWVNF